MKYLLYTCLIALFLNSCASSKNYLERSDEDKALLDAIKKLNKSATDENASSAIPVLYSNIKASRLAKINTLKTEKDLSRWDKLIRFIKMGVCFFCIFPAVFFQESESGIIVFFCCILPAFIQLAVVTFGIYQFKSSRAVNNSIVSILQVLIFFDNFIPTRQIFFCF